MQECEVTAIHTTDSKVTGVETTLGDFSAPIIINAAGAWATGVGRMVGLSLPIETWRHDTMFIRRPAQLKPSWTRWVRLDVPPGDRS